jgi:4-amino-4-deoxy-L-arabinose transferase-like glycosyltransferase
VDPLAERSLVTRRLGPLFALVILYFLLGLGYSLVVPLGESPDEVDHVRYVQCMANKGRLPVMQPVAADNDTMEANQPPLYYLLGVMGWGQPPVDSSELVALDFAPCFPPDPADPGRKQFYLHNTHEQLPYTGIQAAFWRVRLVSLALGAGTVLLAYILGRQLVSDNDRPALLAAAFVAFNPQFLFITASVNNDNLTALLGAAIVAASVAVVEKMRPGRVFGLGVLLGLAALTKLALFALWPVALLAVGWAAYRSAGSWPARIRQGIWPLITLIITPLVIAGWWYLRGQRLYGDPLAWEVHLLAKGSSVLREGSLRLVDLGDFLVQHFQSYWATFGWLNIQPPAIVYWLLLALVLVAITGLLLVLKDQLVGNHQAHRSTDTPSISGLRSPVSVLPSAIFLNLLAILFVYLALLRYIQTINFSGYQGRLAFAVVGPVAALLALGLWRIGGRVLAWVSGAGMLLLAVGCLFLVVLPAFPRPDIYQPANVSERVCARFDGWQLEALSVPETVAPGETLLVTLHGYGLAQSAVSTKVTLDLVGQNGVVEGEVSTIVQAPGRQPFMLTIFLPVAENAAPGPVLIRIRPDESHQLTNARGQVLETYLPLSTTTISP